MVEPAAALAGDLRRLMAELRPLVGDDRGVLVGFDRGSWSPALFADLAAAGFDTLTWPRATPSISTNTPSPPTATPTSTALHTWRLADTEVELDITEGPRAGEVFAMRQISLFESTRTRQMHILTTRNDLPAAEIRYRMGSRWRQQNHYRCGTHPLRPRLPRHLPRQTTRPAWCATRPK